MPSRSESISRTSLDGTRLFEVFEEASLLEGDARRGFLDAACQGQPDQRRLLDAMLGNVVPTAAVQPGLASTDPPAIAALPSRVGPYVPKAVVGTGGMGVVLRATHETLERDVALKMVRAGQWASQRQLQQLVQEAHVLARLDHPNIARVLDAGMTEDGIPYLAMEFVDGLPFDRYADTHRLSTVDRLRLFLGVCAGVQFAHQNLIVHRDIKPSNVLVANDHEGTPTPKLLDFGIAKLVAPDATQRTRTGERLLTPAYASPEQARGEPVTTASDVYALGVLLFETLTGRTPHALGGRSPSEVERILSDEEAPLLSAAAASMPPESMATRSSSRDLLVRSLRGDLDQIAQKALHRDPTRRYASAAALAEDIERYLDGRPVLAQPDSARYRTGKFVRRHARALSASLALTLAALAALLVYTVQVRAARDDAEAARDRAEQVTQFVVTLFEQSDPSTSPRPDLTLSDALDEGLDRVRSQAGERVPADVMATLLDTGGRIYTSLALFEEADSLISQAKDIRLGTPGLPPGDLAASIHSQARLEDLRTHYALADSLYRVAWTLQEEALGPLDPAVLLTLRRLARTTAADKQGPEALRIWEVLLERELEAYGSDAVEVGITIRDMIPLVRDEAAKDSLLAEATRILESQLTMPHTEIAELRLAQAMQAQRQGDAERYVSLLEEAVTINENVFGLTYPSVAASLNDLSIAYFSTGQPVKAVDAARRALDIHVAIYGERSRGVAVSAMNLGGMVASTGDFAEAEALFVMAREAARSLGETNHILAQVIDQEGYHVWAAQGNWVRTEQNFREASAIARVALRDERLYSRAMLVRFFRNHVHALIQLERWTEAEPVQLEILEHERSYNPDSPGLARLLSNMITIYHNQFQCDEVDALVDELIELNTRVETGLSDEDIRSRTDACEAHRSSQSLSTLSGSTQ